MDRRDFVRLSTLGLVAVPVLGACTDEKPPAPSPTPTSTGDALQDVGPGAANDLLLGPAQEEVLVGERRIAFGMRDPEGSAARDAKVTVYAGLDPLQPPVVSAPATMLKESVESQAIYVADLALPSAGAWLLAAVAELADGSRHKGGFQVPVTATSTAPKVGGRPPATATPTTAKPGAAKPLCSRVPAPCSMHAVSFDAALKSGKPTVITFAAPSFCKSETCGPVVNVVETVAKDFAGRINFIHVEAYGADKNVLAPPLVPWKFASEPWTYFIGSDGLVKDRISGALGGEEVRARVATLT